MPKKTGMETATGATIDELRKSVKITKENEFEWVDIFAIYDKKGKKFDIPFFAHNALFAKRKFMLMADEQGILQKFLEDFELVQIGQFNIINGHIQALTEVIIEGKNIRKELQNYEISNEA